MPALAVEAIDDAANRSSSVVGRVGMSRDDRSRGVDCDPSCDDDHCGDRGPGCDDDRCDDRGSSCSDDRTCRDSGCGKNPLDDRGCRDPDCSEDRGCRSVDDDDRGSDRCRRSRCHNGSVRSLSQ